MDPKYSEAIVGTYTCHLEYLGLVLDTAQISVSSSAEDFLVSDSTL